MSTWVCCGEFQKGDIVHVKKEIKIKSLKLGSFKDIFSKNKYEYATIKPSEDLTIISVPEDNYDEPTGFGSSRYFPNRYTVTTKDEKSIIGIPERYLTRLEE